MCNVQAQRPPSEAELAREVEAFGAQAQKFQPLTLQACAPVTKYAVINGQRWDWPPDQRWGRHTAMFALLHQCFCEPRPCRQTVRRNPDPCCVCHVRCTDWSWRTAACCCCVASTCRTRHLSCHCVYRTKHTMKALLTGSCSKVKVRLAADAAAALLQFWWFKTTLNADKRRCRSCGVC